MNKPILEKDRLIKDLTQISRNLEELASALELAFSEHRCSLKELEQWNITAVDQKLAVLENNWANSHPETKFHPSKTSKALKLEMGY